MASTLTKTRFDRALLDLTLAFMSSLIAQQAEGAERSTGPLG